jgi:hypothetical protein
MRDDPRMKTNPHHDLRLALTFSRHDETQRFRVVYETPFRERRVIDHLTHDDAMLRVDALRKRAYRPRIELMPC